jgi:FAD/FMN-containing dehydrogenase
MPFGLRNYWSGRFLSSLPDDLISFLVAHFSSSHPDTSNTVLFEPLHGAAARVEPATTAFGFRHARFNVSGLAVWTDSSLDHAEIAWASDVRTRLAPHSTGGYLNYITDTSADPVEDAFAPEAYARLRAVKTSWDPDNLLRFNHNISPAPQQHIVRG